MCWELRPTLVLDATPDCSSAACPCTAPAKPRQACFKLSSPGCVPAAVQNPPRTSDPHKLLWKLWRFPDGPANGEPEVNNCSGRTAAMHSCLGWCMQGWLCSFAALHPVAWGLQTTVRCSGLQLPASCRARRCMARGGRSTILIPCSRRGLCNRPHSNKAKPWACKPPVP